MEEAPLNSTALNNASFINATAPFFGGCFAIKCHFKKSERIAIILVYSLTFLASFAGNFIVVFVITRARRLRNCTNFSILNLCIADLMVTIFCIPILTIDFYIADEWLFGAFMCKMVTFLQTAAVDASVLVLVAISIEKFVVVCFPFQSRVYRRWFRYIVILMWFVAVADASHTTVFKKLKTFAGREKCIMSYPSSTFMQDYLMGHAVALFFLPLLVMTVLHCITVFVIQKKISTRSSLPSQRVQILRVNVRKLHRKRKAVAILVVIVVLFAISWGPYLSIAIWDAFFSPRLEDVFEYYLLLNKISVAFLWMVFFNSACHPVIYCFLGREYRMAVRNSFRRSNTSSTRTTRHRQQPAIPLKRCNYIKADHAAKGGQL